MKTHVNKFLFILPVLFSHAVYAQSGDQSCKLRFEGYQPRSAEVMALKEKGIELGDDALHIVQFTQMPDQVPNGTNHSLMAFENIHAYFLLSFNLIPAMEISDLQHEVKFVQRGPRRMMVEGGRYSQHDDGYTIAQNKLFSKFISRIPDCGTNFWNQ